MPGAAFQTWLPVLTAGAVDDETLARLPSLTCTGCDGFWAKAGWAVSMRRTTRRSNRPVAIKFMAELGQEARERFLIEARAVARLMHPNVVAVHSVQSVLEVPYLVTGDSSAGRAWISCPGRCPSPRSYRSRSTWRADWRRLITAASCIATSSPATPFAPSMEP